MYECIADNRVPRGLLSYGLLSGYPVSRRMRVNVECQSLTSLPPTSELIHQLFYDFEHFYVIYYVKIRCHPQTVNQFTVVKLHINNYQTRDARGIGGLL